MLDTAAHDSFVMKFDIGAIKHLGLQMYSTLPPVIGELVANAWDANATRVDIEIPEDLIVAESEITVKDDGDGMDDRAVREAYLVIGRDRREMDGTDETPEKHRKVMGRKGIGKLSGFGIAGEIEVETVKDGQTSRFAMKFEDLKQNAERREMRMPPLPPTQTLDKGTRVTLRNISKYRTRRINVNQLRRGLARRFAVIGTGFDVIVNGQPITIEERDLRPSLEKDGDGKPFLWEFNEEIRPDTGWIVRGWIGSLPRTFDDGIQRGITIMARGKLVQEPFVFDAVVGQQYALSYLIGELHAEFVDEAVDTVSTSRNALVWDTEANTALKEWGDDKVGKIAREWAEKRSEKNEKQLASNPLYIRFSEEAARMGNNRAKKIADNMIRDMIKKNPVAEEDEQLPTVQMCLDFLEFDAFWELAQDLTNVPATDTGRVLGLFREWEIVEAKEMMRVTGGRIATIQKLQELIDTNALEVPVLHSFLKEFTVIASRC